MSDKTMAEVLAKHQTAHLAFRTHTNGSLYDCECGERFHDSAAHQADALVAAGFGDERDTAERVWDECERAQYVISLDPNGTAWEALKTNPYRAAAVRGEG